MKNNLSKPVLLASLLAILLSTAPPSLRAEDPSAAPPRPPENGPTPSAGSGNGSHAGDSGTADKPAAKKKKRKKRKKKPEADGGTAPAPAGNGGQGPPGELSSGISPVK
jgi:hypothetical protein